MDNFIQAYVLDKDRCKVALIKVPIIMDDVGLPDVPRFIVCHGWYALLEDKNPLTYSAISKPESVEVIRRF